MRHRILATEVAAKPFATLSWQYMTSGKLRSPSQGSFGVHHRRRVAKVRSDREGLYELIRTTVLAGGSVFCGEDSVIEQLARDE